MRKVIELQLLNQSKTLQGKRIVFILPMIVQNVINFPLETQEM